MISAKPAAAIPCGSQTYDSTCIPIPFFPPQKDGSCFVYTASSPGGVLVNPCPSYGNHPDPDPPDPGNLNAEAFAYLYYDCQGATDCPAKQEARGRVVDGWHTFDIPATVPHLNGFTFDQWAEFPSDGNEENITYQPGGTVQVAFGDKLVLHAIWKKNAETAKPPTITIPGDETIHVGDSFDPMKGVTAADSKGNDLTNAVKITGSMDNSTPGTYALTYTVTDSNGLTATANRTITVLDATFTTIACAPQTGDPAASIWQATTLLLGICAILLAGVTLRMQRRIRRRI